jgi:hypothetical protein
MLGVAEGRGFAGGADRHQAVRALLDLPVDELLESLLVDLAAGERRDQRDERSLEHGVSPGCSRTPSASGRHEAARPYPRPLPPGNRADAGGNPRIQA